MSTTPPGHVVRRRIPARSLRVKRFGGSAGAISRHLCGPADDCVEADHGHRTERGRWRPAVDQPARPERNAPGNDPRTQNAASASINLFVQNVFSGIATHPHDERGDAWQGAGRLCRHTGVHPVPEYLCALDAGIEDAVVRHTSAAESAPASHALPVGIPFRTFPRKRRRGKR